MLKSPWRSVQARRRTFEGAHGLINRVFVFDPALATLVTSMALRSTTVPVGGSGTAPIVQGKFDGSGTPDVLSYLRGNQVFENNYATFDPTQGTICFWWRPEKSRDATQTNDEYIWRPRADTNIRYEHDNAQIVFLYNNASVAASLTTVAGTVYFIVCRFSVNNKINETNYLSISINDSHTYGHTSAISVNAALATIFLGNDGDEFPANGIISHLTIYNRVWGDGTYGNPAVSGTDEINLAYAAGAGKRPVEVVAEGFVFEFPGSGTAGALTTGAGHAHNFPWDSNKGEHWLNEDGFYGGGKWAVAYNGTTTKTTVADNATIQDIHDAAFTLTIRARLDGYGELSSGIIATKGTLGTNGWGIQCTSGSGIQAIVSCATTDAVSRSGTDEFTADGKWHTITMYFDDAGDRKVYLAIDGKWVSSYSLQQAGVGAIVTDVGSDLIFGNDPATVYTLDGVIGWSDISDNDRYSHGTDFISPITIPAADANTIEQWAFDEGTGVTAAAVVNSPANDGTISNGTWERQNDQVGTPVIPYSVEFDGIANQGVNCGSDASIDDLPNGATFCVEAWIRPDGYGYGGTGYIVEKFYGTGPVGWSLQLSQAYPLRAYVNCATTAAETRVTNNTLFSADGKWHHVVMQYDDTGDKKIYFAIDGVWLVGGVTQIAGVGAYQSDASRDLYIGGFYTLNSQFDGGIGFVRVSNNARYTVGTDFIPPARLNPPGVDANAVAQWDFRDGAGTTLTEENGNSNGTIDPTRGQSWNITPDMSVDCPGERLNIGGYAIGSDAVDEGYSQAYTGTPGDNLVVLPRVGYERDHRAKPYILVYDDDNTAVIVKHDLPWLVGTHDGGDNQAALSDSSAPRWPSDLIGGVVYNITDGSKATITGAESSIAGTLAGGTDNDWDNGDEYRIFPPTNWFYCEHFCFQLPAGCSNYTISGLNDADVGLPYWHQLMVLPNLVVNGGMEGTYDDESGGGGGTVNVAPGWDNSDCETDGTDTLDEETTIVHSGSSSQKIVVTANNEGIQSASSVFAADTNFYLVLVMLYGISGTVRVKNGAQTVLNATVTPTVGAWKPYSFIARGTGIAQDLRILGGSAADFRVDDIAVIPMNPVTVTATPRNAANSVEQGGICVDGLDKLTQPIPAGILGSTSGTVEITGVIFRHGAADIVKFGSTNPNVCIAYKDATNLIRLRFTAANTLTFDIICGGVTTSSALDVTGLITAGIQYAIKIIYSPTVCEFYLDDVLRGTLTPGAGINFGANIPDVLYLGSGTGGIQQVDAIFK